MKGRMNMWQGITSGVAIAALLAVLPWAAFGQKWEKTFGGSKEDAGQIVIPTRDWGYLLIGYSETSPDNDLDILVIRMDVDGRVVWQRVYDEGFQEHAYGAAQTEDGGFLIVGDITMSSMDEPDMYLLKISPRGDMEWSKTYGGQEKDVLNDVVTTPEGDFVAIGDTRNTANGEADIVVLKVDAQGNMRWMKTYGSPQEERGNALTLLPDGLAFTGSVSTNIIDKDIITYKVNANGDSLWFRQFGSQEREVGRDIIRTRDGALAIAGLINDNSDALLIKYDANGNQRWSRSLDGSGLADEASGLVQLPTGEFILTGLTETSPANIDLLVAKVAENGDPIWFRNLGKDEPNALIVEEGIDIAPTPNGGYIIAGSRSLGGGLLNEMLLFKTDDEADTYNNQISGTVFFDQDGLCDLDTNDLMLEGWLVEAKSDDITFFGTTDQSGKYDILVDTGFYEVNVLPLNAYWKSCVSAGYNVSLNAPYDTTFLQFPITPKVGCPFLEVQVDAPFVAACNPVTYTINYNNQGSDTAFASQVVVTLDDELSFTSSSLPPAGQNGQELTFNTGDLPPFGSGSFTLTADVACDVNTSQAVLVQANIFPDTICIPAGPAWDGSSVQVEGDCAGDEVEFTIRNVGSAPMQNLLEYIVVEDVIILREGNFQLPTDGQLPVTVPANGSTYRMIAEQSPDHPGSNLPTVVVEGCTTDPDGEYSTGNVTDFPENDGDPYIDINAQEILDLGLSPNTMRGYPNGYRDTLISASTDLVYTVFFRNDGPDTLTRLVIRDTLPAAVLSTSVRMGTSSHPFTWEVYDGGILRITFDSLNLLPNDGSAANQGFVTYTLSQKPNNPDGTIIANRAAIFFDYQDPVLTNTVWHEVGPFPEFIVTSTWEPARPRDWSVKVYPNPLSEWAIFEVHGTAVRALTLEIMDAQGRLLQELTTTAEQSVRLEQGRLSSGWYAYRLKDERGRVLDTGQLIVR